MHIVAPQHTHSTLSQAVVWNNTEKRAVHTKVGKSQRDICLASAIACFNRYSDAGRSSQGGTGRLCKDASVQPHQNLRRTGHKRTPDDSCCRQYESQIAESIHPLFQILSRILKELELIEKSGYTKYPPRLPEQPIFYPVLNEKYATEIASGWNVTYNSIPLMPRICPSIRFRRWIRSVYSASERFFVLWQHSLQDSVSIQTSISKRQNQPYRT